MEKLSFYTGGKHMVVQAEVCSDQFNFSRECALQEI